MGFSGVSYDAFEGVECCLSLEGFQGVLGLEWFLSGFLSGSGGWILRFNVQSLGLKGSIAGFPKDTITLNPKPQNP